MSAKNFCDLYKFDKVNKSEKLSYPSFASGKNEILKKFVLFYQYGPKIRIIFLNKYLKVARKICQNSEKLSFES